MTRPAVFFWLGDDLAMGLLLSRFVHSLIAKRHLRAKVPETWMPVDGAVEEWQIHT
jgi:hypothetical protein